MENKKIIILAGGGDSGKIIYNSLKNDFNIDFVIIEDKENSKVFLKRRIKKLGFLTVLGQIMFSLVIALPLRILSGKRIKEILKINNLSAEDIPEVKIKRVSSVNSKNSITLLKNSKPDLVILAGTRIISQKVLDSVSCDFINIHAGITPKYRGVHGAYWALVNNDEENNGVTLHFVDKGIDTGMIISQVNIYPEQKDNFITYPYLQLAAGIKELHKDIVKYFNDGIVLKDRFLKSRLWYHPTIWQYIYYRIFRGIK